MCNQSKKKKEELYNMIINYGLLNKVYHTTINDNKTVVKERLDKELVELKETLNCL